MKIGKRHYQNLFSNDDFHMVKIYMIRSVQSLLYTFNFTWNKIVALKFINRLNTNWGEFNIVGSSTITSDFITISSLQIQRMLNKIYKSLFFD